MLLTAMAGVGLCALPASGRAEEVRVIDVVASRFKFEPATIVVAEGDTLRLRLRSADRTHGIEIKGLHVKQSIPSGGDVVTVEFVAERRGTFEITCSEYCGTGHSAMKGTLLVGARGSH
ncbi:MAG TPA: cupredoxin domain-containing protein [Vicinamibacterales bacterium]